MEQGKGHSHCHQQRNAFSGYRIEKSAEDGSESYAK